ncbi:structural maintenance of chromosomes protein 5 [Diachasma alloeum]|uniref:structural maintenance of chromosomes protein 5 n=1 Tax=Diachasma alloeum TaxID=454923 RepID=UPI0007385045|nr:structural maintenance of chromosomes protein 5 [Diachasma alloeum]
MGGEGDRKRFQDRGIIVEIRLENFITYGNAVVHPGRHLNVIIGPNGTGKSTIATALALGFGGTPKLIGKPDMQVGMTVKAGCQKARIDIVIRNTPTENTTFSRTIDRQSKSTFLINNNVVTSAKFKEAVKDFRIQVDNLTQFLPQENIKGFSELSGKQLLFNTERSVSDTSLEAHHKTLIENRDQQKLLEQDIAQRSTRLASSEQRHAALTGEVNQFKERKNLKKKLQALKQKRAWIKYDIQRKELMDVKKRRDEAAQKMKLCDERLAPMDAAIKSLQAEVKALDRKFELNTMKITDFNKQYKKCLEDIEDLNHMIKTEEQKCKAEMENEKKRDDKILAQRQMSEKYENDMLALEEEYGAEDELRRQIQELDPQIQVHRSAITSLSEELNNRKAEAEQLSYQINSLKREHKSLKDIESKRLDILMGASKDAYKGVMWLRENTHLFKKKVWEPMLLYIQVKDNRYSKYFENTISHRDLIAFVCEDKEDMGLLLSHLRTRMKLKVNVVHSDVFRPINMTPRISLSDIKRFGFTHYLIDLIDAPEPILKYVVNMYHLQNIPIGTNRVEETFEQVPATFFSFFSLNKHYAVSRSKYSGQKSTRIRETTSSGTLSITLDSARISEIERRVAQLTQMKDGAVSNFQVLEEKIKREKAALDQLREQKQVLTGHYNRIQSTTFKISEAEKKLKQLEAERIDVEDVKKRRDGVIKNLVRKQMKFYGQINDSCEAVFKVAKVCESLELQIKAKNHLVSERQRESRELREQAKDAEREWRVRETAMVELNNKTRELQAIARDMTDGKTPQDKEGFKQFNAAFSKLPPTIDEIDEMIQNTQMRIYVSKDYPDAENTVREYERIGAQIEKYREELETLNRELASNREETERVREMWLPPLKVLVDQISSNFSGYLEKLGCAGEVKLIHGDNPNDFDEYALKIMVKFRAEEPLQEFTKSRQSGGETSLTTAMYMIALQEMSQVPFRCVDEINQGMDATNDRKVFEHIMEITARGNSSQYFLLTPKLLPNLPYNDSVSVLCVFNGPAVVPHTVWTLEKYCKKLKGRKRQKLKERA